MWLTLDRPGKFPRQYLKTGHNCFFHMPSSSSFTYTTIWNTSTIRYWKHHKIMQ